MSDVLIIGDGPLAYEMAALAEKSGHHVITYLFGHQGPKINPLAQLPAYLTEMADRVDLVVEAVIGSRAAKRFAIEGLNTAFLGASEPILSAVHNASVAEVSGWVVHPENVVGWAALPPLKDVKVFELASGLRGNPASLEIARAFLASL